MASIVAEEIQLYLGKILGNNFGGVNNREI